MRVRHRNGPGNGYRSNALGVGGMAAASRISPEGLIRGQRMYDTEYRNIKRGGYGRGGHSKQSQRMPSRETDVFVEAGRLAAEYLVSKGVLPANVLSGKWVNDDVMDQANNFQGFRQHEVNKTQTTADGRAPTHSHLGNAALEAGPGRRRSFDEYDSMGSRLSVRGRKRTAPFRNGGSEMKRELGRSGSWAEASGASPGMETDNDGFVVHHAKQPAGKDVKGGMQSSSGEAIQEVDSEVPIKSGSEKCNSVGDTHVNNGTLNSAKNLPSDTDGEPIKRSAGANEFDDVSEVPKEDGNNDNLQQKYVETKSSEKDGTSVSEDHVDLAKRCKFVNIPTKARSSLRKGPNGVQNSMNEDGKFSNRELSEASGFRVINVNVGSSSCKDLSNQNHEHKSSQSDVLNDPSIEKELGGTHPAKPGQCLRAGSSLEISVYKEREPNEGVLEFQSPNYMFMERGVKRAIDYTPDGREDSKKIKLGVSPVDTQADRSSSLCSSYKNQPPLQEPNNSQSALGTLVTDHKILDISLIPKSEANSCEFTEKKQLFSGSFKTCDLNLSGTCDVTENHEADPIIIFPSVTQPGEVGAPIDVDLSMGNNHNMPDKSCKHGVKDIDIEVIDLENDSVQVHMSFSNPERRADTLFNDLDGFPNNMHNANGIPDVQDGYGLMISELLGNDSPSCSSVRTDLNSLNNHMDLANTEGVLGDDDSIYMSLGEIPISLLGPWEQPMQDYGKPF